MESYRILVEKDYLSFSAAHFLVFGRKCERLHGHNYAVSVELEGGLTEIGYVFDFIDLKRASAEVCDALDHRMILPGKNPHLAIELDEHSVEVLFREKRFVIPAEDVLILPIENITAELLARYICEQIAEKIKIAGAENIAAIAARVYEAPGQSGIFRMELS